MTIYYPNNVIAHINRQLASPVRDPDDAHWRREKKCLVWNDLVADEKIRRVTTRSQNFLGDRPELPRIHG